MLRGYNSFTLNTYHFTGGRGNNNAPGRAAKVVLVYFIGGCTYSEIAALRLLGKLKGLTITHTC
ncbi:hypothetical protein DPMN_110041 [Dreissena polymorpha]|uniref:Uncharacterized protein n=1 Tax=Dreissena polymorpha TaxID=45954 RepID=A0A9D4QNM0_DREPO|nr:hypothetical protein DPMN_110041 [Dreissena polymorpha]